MLPLQKDQSDDEFEETLHLCLLHRLIQPDEMRFAEGWLNRIARSRSAASSIRRDAREEATLLIAKRASRYAMYAAVIATVSAIVQAKDMIFALIK